MLIVASIGLTVASILFATRKVLGYCFSNEKEVVDYVTTMAPLVCASVILDSLQGVLSDTSFTFSSQCQCQKSNSPMKPLYAYYG
ncbi:hypothetical protein RND81_02G132300 [Saponaria officinalis]|uniref:Uncharacterized protein n=1 Tax=Saponaria officinalis TaxID=3572 RepID=A0AAW1MTB0_SAPOF